MTNFAFKSMNFIIFIRSHGSIPRAEVSAKHDETLYLNDDFCILMMIVVLNLMNFCAKSDNFCVKSDERLC